MFFILALVAAFLQFTILRVVNFLVVLAVFSGIRKGPLAGLLMGSTIGVLAGIFSASSFMLNIILYAMVGFSAGVARSKMFYKETVFSEFMFSFAGTILFYGAFFILTDIPQPFIFYTGLLSAAFSPLIFRLAER